MGRPSKKEKKQRKRSARRRRRRAKLKELEIRRLEAHQKYLANRSPEQKMLDEMLLSIAEDICRPQLVSHIVEPLGLLDLIEKDR